MSPSFSLFWEEFDSMAHIWNTQVIKPLQKQGSPIGKPIVMYHLSHIYGFQNELREVNQQRMATC